MQDYGKTVDYLVRNIVRKIKPLRIILFGSVAKGTMSENSDIDIMVVVPEGTHRRRTAQALYRSINGVGVPFDIIVATPRDLEEHRNNIGLVYREILSEGKEIYAA